MALINPDLLATADEENEHGDPVTERRIITIGAF
jgi:hypothetical protein